MATVDAIAHHIDGVALLREPTLQVIGRLDLVFNNQDSHRFGRDCAAPAPVSRWAGVLESIRQAGWAPR